MNGESDSAEQCGQVIWRFKHPAGYYGGLEQIEDNSSFRHHAWLYWFCRDLAITVGPHPEASQRHIIENSRKLVEKGIITPDQLSYLYEQFDFNPDDYQPPLWGKPDVT